MPLRTLRELMAVPHLPRGAIEGPLVSFLMPTYGRAARQPEVIAEAVYWFTRQTHPSCELLILNDAPGQKLACGVPGVSVYNWPFRVPTLGEKMNLAVRLAAGTVCLPYEDDDVSLPWRAEQAVLALARHDYWEPGLWWYYEQGGVPVADGKGVGHNCCAYRRAQFLGRYAPVTRGHDAAASAWAKEHLRVNPYRIEDPSDISYFYRWGVSDYHLSAVLGGEMDLAYDGATPGPDGEYTIVPQMREDFVALHQRLCGHG